MGNDCCVSNRKLQHQTNFRRQTQDKNANPFQNFQSSILIVDIQSWRSVIYKAEDVLPYLKQYKFQIVDSVFIAKIYNQNPQLTNDISKLKQRDLRKYDFALSIQRNKQSKQFEVSEITKRYQVWERMHNPFQLKVGEFFRVGRIQFQLKSLILNESDLQKPLIPLKIIEKRQQIRSNISQFPQCRICLLNQNNSSNPLLKPCDCSGSIQFIHLQCMKVWLKITSEDNIHGKNSLIVNLIKQKCQVCKRQILTSTAFEQLIYSLLVNEKNLKPPLILLEGTLTEKSTSCKSFFIYSFKNSSVFAVGRKIANQLHIEHDITVSHIHSNVYFDERTKKIGVSDVGSKFGTWKKAPEQIKIMSKQNRSFNIKYNSIALRIQEWVNPEDLRQ